jgi:putative DeoR family transcriptional regulator (stage III sporulation protein D)
MKQQPSDRAMILGEYILEHQATVRAAAAWFGISKSTVHKDVSQRLPTLSPSLSAGVKEILNRNKQERHIRGGMATKEKYARLAAFQKQQQATHTKMPDKQS